jgi:two-component system response regulator MprA
MSPVVLVVDDEATNRNTLANLLSKEGYSVATAADGLEALEKLREGLSPCLIVFDLMMPRLDGFAFRERQLADPAWANIPVVAISATWRPRVEAVVRLFDALLSKPMQLPELLATIELLLRFQIERPSGVSEATSSDEWTTGAAVAEGFRTRA